MRLSSDTVISIEKMANYLLTWRAENDKSRFLGLAGYTENDADRLAADIRHQLLTLDAEFEETTLYGDVYMIVGLLTGPNGRELRVTTVWMIEKSTLQTKFITLYPAKEE